jgi:membrane peptidoglycan carboxypeptidase
MQGYKTNATFAAKTGTSPYDSLCIGYNPNYTILSWVGYDDNRELTSSTDKRVPKIIFQNIANSLQEEDIWYDSSSLSRIPINVHTGEYNDSGLIYWFK